MIYSFKISGACVLPYLEELQTHLHSVARSMWTLKHYTHVIVKLLFQKHWASICGGNSLHSSEKEKERILETWLHEFAPIQPQG